MKSKFFIRLTNWEYWPFGIIQAPLFFYYPWLCLKARSFFFFSASNPGILMGGMFGESKFEVMNLLPGSVKPTTLLQKLPVTADELMKTMSSGGLPFPVIFKPDLGERGWMVKRIDNKEDVAEYLRQIKIDFIIQEFVDLPLEFGVFYLRFPDQQNGKVISIVQKEMLHVVGNGKQTVSELILENDRARLQWEKLQMKFSSRLKEVLSVGEKLELVSIGNHSLGTKFLNANSLITDELSESFDKISKQIDGFYFGRFDLRASSVKALQEGKVSIVELNGCGAEPAHIYDPSFSLMEAIGVLINHWRNIYLISTQNHRKGVPYISFKDGKSIYRKFKAAVS